MGWTYKQKKMRDTVRAEYTATTGNSTFSGKDFENWLVENSHIEPHDEENSTTLASEPLVLTDVEAANLYRVKMAEEFFRGLRFTRKVS